jgi:hypothetical protein
MRVVNFLKTIYENTLQIDLTTAWTFKIVFPLIRDVEFKLLVFRLQDNKNKSSV